MRIHRAVNNNIVIVLDENGQERILMGKGIGYRRHSGDEFDESLVDKEVRLAASEQTERLADLVSEISPEVVDAAAEIMAEASENLKKELNGGAVISLSDHIHTAVQRSRGGIFVKNVLLWETKRFYQEEFRVGLKALDVIEEKTGVRLPEDEAGFIALHIVNAQMEESAGDLYGLTKVMQEIMSIIILLQKAPGRGVLSLLPLCHPLEILRSADADPHHLPGGRQRRASGRGKKAVSPGISVYGPGGTVYGAVPQLSPLR